MDLDIVPVDLGPIQDLPVKELRLELEHVRHAVHRGEALTWNRLDRHGVPLGLQRSNVDKMSYNNALNKLVTENVTIQKS